MQDETERSSNVTGVAGLFEGGLAVLALAIGHIVGHSPLSTVPLTAEGLPNNGQALLWGLLAAVPMVAGLFAMDWIPLGALVRLKRLVQKLVMPLFRDATTAELALVAVLAGIGEELLFRGLLQDALAVSIGGTAGMWIGLSVAAAVFGLAHAVTRTYAVLATAVGVYLGWLFLATGNLIAPMVAHAVYDFVALVYLVKWQGGVE